MDVSGGSESGLWSILFMLVWCFMMCGMLMGCNF